MRFRIFDPFLQSHAFVVAHLVYWHDGQLCVCTCERDARFRCSLFTWRKIQFFIWAGSTYVDISRLQFLY